MITSNFDFIKIDSNLSEFFSTISSAENNYSHEDYEGVLTKSRKVAENLAHVVASALNVGLADRATFNDVLRSIKSMMPKPVVDAFYIIKGDGNTAAHEINPSTATKENALKILQEVYFLLVWYVRKYSDIKIDDRFLDTFVEPKIADQYRAAERKFIYIQSVDNSTSLFPAYEGAQKIGDGSIPADDMESDWTPNSEFLRQEAPKRISQYMTTSGLNFNLGWVELAYKKSTKSWFRDTDVHSVLKRSGIKNQPNLAGREWFNVDLETAKKAIRVVKDGGESLEQKYSPEAIKEIELRPNQAEAVLQTKDVFKKKDRMLWNAKMRFGKTLTSLQLIKELGFNKVLLMTHRPVVKDSWFDDFSKMKMPEAGYRSGARGMSPGINELKNGDAPFIFFASIQYLRYGGGETNLADFEDVDWDLVIIDEAHEGTQTDLSRVVMKAVVKEHTKVLELSGTPFNLLNKYDEDQVYTWDYTMEQEAKLRWELERPDEKNPYSELPKVSMFTFEMNNAEKFSEGIGASFNFREFFKVNEDGKLKYETDVRSFLDQITTANKRTNYPFSTEEYREELRHTLWLMPGVKEANAFEKLLNEHKVFGVEKGEYKVVNVVRDGDNNGEATQGDLEKVRAAIGDDPSVTKTITLTVRKLTTGVNVPEWTAVLFLSNTNSPMNYLQAAFRAQTPFSHEKLGKKENCFIFDFAPDRALTIMAESAQVNTGAGKKNSQQQKDSMTKLLNFMPILGQVGNQMKTYDVDRMLTQLKKVYAEKAVRSGFDDDSIYNDELLTLTGEDQKVFQDLVPIVGRTNQEKKKKIVINENGLTEEEYEVGEAARKKKKKELTPEEEAILKKIKEAANQRKTMISILRGVSIRIPMMIYGMPADLDEDISIEDFLKKVDNESWEEFMPKGFTKGMFRKIVKYYDSQVFIEAGRIIRNRAKSFDRLDLLERAENIAELFSTFKNPDKETVLTPWRVVNLQIIKSLGGLSFYDKNFENATSEARTGQTWVENDYSAEVYQPGKTFIDINSKTGLYPLHVAMSLYYQALMNNDGGRFQPVPVYEEILKNQVFAIAKTPMAKTITERTLVGYRNLETNVQYVKGLSDLLKQDMDLAENKVKKAFNNVKFDVVVGNPPYQESATGGSTQSPPIYHKFMELSYKLADKVALITPARFLYNAGATPAEFNKRMLSDEHLKVIYYQQDSSKVFPSTDIKGGVVVTFRDSTTNFGKIETFIALPELRSISKKVDLLRKESLSSIISGRGVYRLTDEAIKYMPEIVEIQSKGHKYDIGTSAFKLFTGKILFEEKPDDGEYIKIIGLGESGREYRWINSKFINKPDNLNKYKVVLPNANGSGAIGEVLSTPMIGVPMIGFTETFISIGEFETSDESNNCLKYVKSKFCRALLGVLKITQHNTRDKWQKVPLENFTNNSDIPWDKSIPEIDQYLYSKYGLSDGEIEFIEEKVATMA